MKSTPPQAAKAAAAGTFSAPSPKRQIFGGTAGFLRPAAYLLIPALLGLAAALLLPRLFAPAAYGSLVRLPVALHTLGPDDFPQGLRTRFPESDWGMPPEHAFAPALDGGAQVRGEALAEAFEGPESGHYGFAAFAPHAQERGLVNFSHGLVSIATAEGAMPLALLRHSPIPNMPQAPDIFQSDMFTPVDYSEGDIPPLLYGEETDEQGRPSRWGRPENALPGLLACSLDSARGSTLFELLRKARFIPGSAFSGRSERYQSMARRYAEKYDLASSLVLAIMHTESNFDPYAVSRSQAVGLMQIVPETAGHEVYRYLTGLPGQPHPEALFSPEHNIKYGAIYLHLLGRRYFGGVTNPRSRQMCVIAAYNGGPGAVLRLFDSEQEAAVERINALSPDALYKALTTDMPNAETRRYVEIVLSRMQNYSML